MEVIDPNEPRRLRSAPTRELLTELAVDTTELVKKEVALAKAELRSNVKSEIATVEGLGVAGVCMLLTLNLMLVAVVFALSQMMPGWAAALIVAGFTLLIATVAGLIGWRKRVRRPLERTERTLKEDARWARQRVTR